jgi:hypothetical protein
VLRYPLEFETGATHWRDKLRRIFPRWNFAVKVLLHGGTSFPEIVLYRCICEPLLQIEERHVEEAAVACFLTTLKAI